jgi:hypothetical protein
MSGSAMGVALHIPIVWRLLRRLGLSRTCVLLLQEHYASKWLYRVGSLKEARSVLRVAPRTSWEQFLRTWRLQIALAVASFIVGAGSSWLVLGSTPR